MWTVGPTTVQFHPNHNKSMLSCLSETRQHWFIYCVWHKNCKRDILYHLIAFFIQHLSSNGSKPFPSLFPSSQAMDFEMHFMALHRVHVQIDYSATLAYHTLPSWWLLTLLFLFPFCFAYHRMNDFLPKVVLHDTWWVRVCPLSPIDIFPGGKAGIRTSSGTFTLVLAHKSHPPMDVHKYEQLATTSFQFSHFLQELLLQVASGHTQLYGLETDPCNLNDFRRPVCSTCVALSFIFSGTHHKSAVPQIMKIKYNAIKIQGAIKGLKWAEGDLEDLDY